MTVKQKNLNLALQGGGSHGAFTWGVLDRLLEDGRIRIDGICGTSAGAMNAIVCAYGNMQGGPEKARELLHDFWQKISSAGARYSPLRSSPFDAMFNDAVRHASYAMFDTMTRAFSPYQLNPLNFNPLREVLEDVVRFKELKGCKDMRVFVCATNVRTGKPKVFHNHEVTADAVLASACLPTLFQAVEIDGEYYWDGGYVGNPPIYPLIYETDALDVLVVHINPFDVPKLPRSAGDIMDRINEISFNSSLVSEMRAIAFVQKLITDGWIKDEFRSQLRDMRMHAIRADKDLPTWGWKASSTPAGSTSQACATWAARAPANGWRPISMRSASVRRSTFGRIIFSGASRRACGTA